MRYCLRCCYPENSKPYIIFDEKGVCSGCRAFEQRQSEDVNWDEKHKELKLILDEYKKIAEINNSPYDCIIPVSGGKDSHFQTYLITQIYKMKPLLVAYNHSYNTEVGIKNLSNIVEKFGCDLLRFSTNPKTAKKISLHMLKKVGDMNWHYHAGIMTFPIQTAVRYKIPLIVWGEHGESLLHGMHNLEDKVEFTKKNRQEHMMRGFEPNDILEDECNSNITKYDLGPFFYPENDEIERIKLKGIYLWNYHKWDHQENVKMLIKNYGFTTMQKRETSFNLYEKIEDFFQDTHNYLKYLKFGYSRCTDHASFEIRNQRMTREEGIEMIRKFEYGLRPKNLDTFLKFVGISEIEFLKIIEPLRDNEAWIKNENGEYVLKDWIGNHVEDIGIDEVRLPIKEKWNEIKSSDDHQLRSHKELDGLIHI